MKINWTAVGALLVSVVGILGEHADKLPPNVAHGVIIAGLVLQAVTKPAAQRRKESP